MENNWILCGAGPAQLQDGPHLLTVNANVGNEQTFWFDQIQYAPSANVSLNQSLLRIDPSDPAIQYSSGLWNIVGNPINYTSTLGKKNVSSSQANGAFLTYEFSGS
jgi:signal transduction histidine kinase